MSAAGLVAVWDRVNGVPSHRPQSLLRKHLDTSDVPFCRTEPAGLVPWPLPKPSLIALMNMEGKRLGASLLTFLGACPLQRMLSFEVPWHSVCSGGFTQGLEREMGPQLEAQLAPPVDPRLICSTHYDLGKSSASFRPPRVLHQHGA